jgi:hypothetical protein
MWCWVVGIVWCWVMWCWVVGIEVTFCNDKTCFDG